MDEAQIGYEVVSGSDAAQQAQIGYEVVELEDDTPPPSGSQRRPVILAMG